MNNDIDNDMNHGVSKIDLLSQVVTEVLGDKILSSKIDRGELTIEIASDNLLTLMGLLRNDAKTSFEQCVDLCGVDYSEYGNNYVGQRFAVVYHLLSINHNWRLRVRTFIKNDELPILPSLVTLWSGLDWFEREAFDLFGIIFDGHPDLRRILTDYGFIGHPFRKDFPVYGHMEVRYDENEKRVIYQPVTIEPREIIPRVIREEHYSGRN
jgi:NADH-quinone oxidoreductase subunit C